MWGRWWRPVGRGSHDPARKPDRRSPRLAGHQIPDMSHKINTVHKEDRRYRREGNDPVSADQAAHPGLAGWLTEPGEEDGKPFVRGGPSMFRACRAVGTDLRTASPAAVTPPQF